MHIGLITSEYPHPRVTHAAGIATSIKNLAITLVKKNITVTVFVYSQKENAIIEDEGVTIHLISNKKFAFLAWYKYRKYLQNYINQIVVKETIGVLEAPDWTGITAFMKFKIPLVIRFHGSDAYFCKLDNRKQKFKNFVFEKMALKKASAFIAPSAYAGIETQKIFKLDKNKVKVIRHGLKLENFVNETPAIFDKDTILYIGTIIRKKGVLELAQIFNRVIEEKPSAKLILIGRDAPDIKTGNASTYTLMQTFFSKKAKQQVNYLGEIPYLEVKNYIKNAHICTFSSFAETLGMVTIESMALQKPVVNTSIGWAQELIDDTVNGYLVHPTKIEQYAERILNLLNNETLCLTIGKAARKKVEKRFNIDDIVNENIAYYNKIVSENN